MAVNDLVQLETTVTAVSGSTLTLASVTGLAVGDAIIVESLHGYNETGIDGDWEFTDLPTSNHYYLAVDHIGKSFIATVSGISGNVVTVDRTVPVAAVGLPCYRDNSTAVKYAIENAVAWPSRRRFACAAIEPTLRFPAPIRAMLNDTQATIDFNNCELFAPRGCGSLALTMARIGGGGVNNKILKNLTIRGNVRDYGYGILGETGVYYPDTWALGAFYFGGSSGDTPTFATNVIVENFNIIDAWQAISVNNAKDCFFVNCTMTANWPQRRYIQWDFQATFCFRTAFIGCTVISDKGRAGFEAFKSQGVTFLNCTGNNASFAANTSGATLYKNCYVIWTDDDPPTAFSQYNAMLSITRTIESQSGAPIAYAVGGIGVINFVVDYRVIPYANSNQIFNTILVSPGDQGIPTNAKINGVTLIVPRTNVTTPNAGYIIRSDEAQTTATGLVGTLDSGNQYIRQGTVIPQ